MRMRTIGHKGLSCLVVLACTLVPLYASGHGPVFGLATPTNARGTWSLDLGLMGRRGSEDTGTMLRGMLSHGITQDVMVSVTVPWVMESTPLPPGRLTGMMAASPDLEGIVSWRFHRRGLDVGKRVESTAFGGVILPGPQRPAGQAGELNRAPGFWAAAASGFASRSHYLWGGVGYKRFAESHGDRRSDLTFYSMVWAYRPTAWRKDYPHWDWRLLAEMTGEIVGSVQRRGESVPGTGGHQVFVGPTALGLYKNYALQGGLQFPVHRSVGEAHQRERLRFAVNLSYFF